MKFNPMKVIFAITVVFVLGIIFLFVGQVKTYIGNESIEVKGLLTSSTTVNYNEITSVEYVTSFDIGTREMGLGTIKLNLGTYNNKEFGKYKLYIYSKVNSFVVAKYGDKALVFNQSTVRDTEKVYNEFKNKVEE